MLVWLFNCACVRVFFGVCVCVCVCSTVRGRALSTLNRRTGDVLNQHLHSERCLHNPVEPVLSFRFNLNPAQTSVEARYRTSLAPEIPNPSRIGWHCPAATACWTCESAAAASGLPDRIEVESGDRCSGALKCLRNRLDATPGLHTSSPHGRYAMILEDSCFAPTQQPCTFSESSSCLTAALPTLDEMHQS